MSDRALRQESATHETRELWPRFLSWRDRLGVMVPILAGAVLIFLLLTQIDSRQILDLCRHVDPRWLLAGGLCYGLSYLFRAARFRSLLASGGIPMGRMYAVACAHGMLNHLLPMRSGEFSYLYFAKRQFEVTMGEAAVSLAIARVLDYLVVSAAFILSSLAVLPALSGAAGWYLVGAVILACIAVILLRYVVRLSNWLHGLGRRMAQHGSGRGASVLRWLEAKLQEIAEAFGSTRNARVYTRSAVFSVLIWLCTFAVFYCFLRALGFGIGYWGVIVGSTFAVLTNVLPLSGIGSFGTLEAGWTAGFLLIGFDKEQAIASGFAVHLLALVIIIILGLAGLARISLDRAR
jgi:uncharacterized protein (TIRG00374 family)